MRPTTAPIMTPPESGCQENAAMEAPVAARKDAAPSGRGGLRHGCAHLIRDGHARQVPSRPPDISCRFATATMSNGRIAICDCLLRFANLLSKKPNRVDGGAEFDRIHNRQRPWRRAGREIGSRTIEGRPGSSEIECGGQNTNSTWALTKGGRIAVCYAWRGFANSEVNRSPKRSFSAKRPAGWPGCSGFSATT
jgi:hypothetical protein